MAQDPPRCGQCDCDERHQVPYAKWRIGDETFRTCPAYLVTERSAAMLRLYSHYTEGHLPMPGSLLEQPNGFVEAVEIIRRAVADDREG